MGKIQDALTRLNTRVRPSANLTKLLRIPAQHEHENSPLPVDAASLKTWLVAQNFVNKGFTNKDTDTGAASAKSLLRALQHSNRTISTPVQRLLIMEQYEKPFAVAMQSLDTQYLYFDFPLQASAEKSFQLAVTLCQEMAYGYKISLADSTRSDGLFSKEKLSKAKKTLAIKNALEHLSQMVLRHSQVYRDWPKDCWRDINTLARVAMQEGIAESMVTDSNKSTSDKFTVNASIKNQYARLCALQIIDQKQYQPEQLRTLFTQLTKHAAELVFHHKPQTPDRKNLVGQNLGGQTHSVQTYSENQYSVGDDNPPALSEFRYHKQSDSELLYFSLDALLNKIDSIEENSKATSIHHHCKRSRTESRAPRAGTITAASGLKEIHTLINLAPPTEKAESQFTDIRQLLQLDNTHPSITQSNTLNSINTTDFGTTFEVENESRNGFGLKWTGTKSCRLQNGELIAHCYRGSDNETSWQLSVVRWLNTQADNTLRLGVESISRHVTAVNVVRLVRGEQQLEKPLEALLVNYLPIDSKAKMLILPQHRYRAGETVGYRDQAGFHLVKLIENVNLAGNFQCFAISSIEQKPVQSNTQSATDVVTDNETDYQAAV